MNAKYNIGDKVKFKDGDFAADVCRVTQILSEEHTVGYFLFNETENRPMWKSAWESELELVTDPAPVPCVLTEHQAEIAQLRAELAEAQADYAELGLAKLESENELSGRINHLEAENARMKEILGVIRQIAGTIQWEDAQQQLNAILAQTQRLHWDLALQSPSEAPKHCSNCGKLLGDNAAKSDYVDGSFCSTACVNEYEAEREVPEAAPASEVSLTDAEIEWLAEHWMQSERCFVHLKGESPKNLHPKTYWVKGSEGIRFHIDLIADYDTPANRQAIAKRRKELGLT